MRILLQNANSLRALQGAIATDKEPRAYLRHIYLDATANALVATDGRVLVRVDLTEDHHAQLTAGVKTVFGDLLPLFQVIGKIRPSWKTKPVLLDFDARAVSLPTNPWTKPLHIALAPEEDASGKYWPDWQRADTHTSVWKPAAKNFRGYFGLDTQQLARVCPVPAKIEPGIDPTGPMRVTPVDGCAHITVMGYRAWKE